MARKDRAALLRALKTIMNLCSEQAISFVEGAAEAKLREGNYFAADFDFADESNLRVSLHVSFRPAPMPKPKGPLMFEGPKA